MRRNELDDEIKTRVPSSVKRELERIAAARELTVSDILREAARLYLARHRLPSPNGKKAQEVAA